MDVAVKLLIALGILPLSLIAAEILSRFLAAAMIGPSALWYGTGRARANASGLQQDAPGYWKYRPGQIRFDRDASGSVFQVTANNQGFRGPDFAREKPHGTVRIVTLGASSTFGYRNRDADTYPFLLKTSLRARMPFTRVEVINLGIPHLASDEILALFRAEALPLAPDVITFYAGANDTRAVEPAHRLRRFTLRLARKLVLVAFVTEFSMLFASRLGFQADDLERHAALISQRYIHNLDIIASECARRHILFLPATEQMTATRTSSQRLGLTYTAEVAREQERSRTTGQLDLSAFRLLVHAEMTRTLHEWSRSRRLRLCPVAEALDRRRNLLVSWVHLHPTGNRIIAETLAEAIVVALHEARVPLPDTARVPAAGPLFAVADQCADSVVERASLLDLLLIGGIEYFVLTHFQLSPVAVVAALAATLLAIVVYPRSCRPINVILSRLAHLGHRVAMTLLFFTVFTPVGFFMRLRTRDPLLLRTDRAGETYWLRHDPDLNPTERLHQQF